MEKSVTIIILAFLIALFFDLNNWVGKPDSIHQVAYENQNTTYSESEIRSGWRMKNDVNATTYYLMGKI